MKKCLILLLALTFFFSILYMVYTKYKCDSYKQIPSSISINNGIDNGIVTIPGWDGWATTTYDSEPVSWPGSETETLLSFNQAKIASKGNGSVIGQLQIGKSGETIDVIGTMPAAIPWPVIASLLGFKNRYEFIATVIESCRGNNNTPCCFIVQPINKFPSEITSTNNNNFQMINNLFFYTILV